MEPGFAWHLALHLRNSNCCKRSSLGVGLLLCHAPVRSTSTRLDFSPFCLHLNTRMSQEPHWRGWGGLSVCSQEPLIAFCHSAERDNWGNSLYYIISRVSIQVSLTSTFCLLGMSQFSASVGEARLPGRGRTPLGLSPSPLTSSGPDSAAGRIVSMYFRSKL